MHDGRKHILLVIPRLHTNLTGWLQGLKGEGYAITAVVSRKGFAEATLVDEVVTLRKSRLSFLLAGRKHSDVNVLADLQYLPSIREVLGLLGRIRPDMVIIRNPSYPQSFAVMLLSWSRRLRCMLYTQNTFYRHQNRKNNLIDQMLRFLGLYWMTPVLGWPSASKMHYRNARYVPFSVQVQDVQPVLRSEGQPVRMLMIGKFVQRKNHLLVIDTVQRLQEQGYTDVQVVLAGEVTTPQMEELYKACQDRIEKFGLQDRVQLRKNIPYAKMGEVYSHADVMLLPSHDEPAAVSHLEAMANGALPVVTQQNGTSCYVQDGVTGFVYDANQKDALLTTLKRVLDLNAIQRQHMQQNIQHSLQENHSPANLARVVQELCGGPR